MKPANSDTPIAFDVDNTLIFETSNTNLHWAKTNDLQFVDIKCPYDDITRKYIIHEEHIKLLKDNRARGFSVVVWSNNGKAWAEAVVKALNLGDYVDDCMSKFIKVIDDQEPNKFLKAHIYLKSRYEKLKELL